MRIPRETKNCSGNPSTTARSTCKHQCVLGAKWLLTGLLSPRWDHILLGGQIYVDVRSQVSMVCIQRFKKEKIIFNSILPLNQLWLKYISRLITDPQNSSNTNNSSNIIGSEERITKIKISEINLKKNFDGIMFKFLRADFNGSYIIVHHSENQKLKNQQGIVILETKHSFIVVDNESKMKTILKKGNIFKFPLFDFILMNEEEYKETNKILKEDPIFVYINGSNFLYKASERTKVRFKKQI